jgi:hypothetical protein
MEEKTKAVKTVNPTDVPRADQIEASVNYTEHEHAASVK